MTQDLHTLIGAYALDALDAIEHDLFVEHLRDCHECAAEAEGLAATTARLAGATSETPPAGMRASVMAEINRTRQDRVERPADGVDDLASVTPLRRVRTRLHMMAAVAAALFVLAGTLGGVAVFEQRRVSQLRQQTSAVAAVYGADDASTQAAAAGSGRITVVSSKKLGRAVAIPHGVHTPKGKSMQVWVIHDGRYRSVGLMSSDAPVLADSIGPGSSLGVTAEPEGGSKQPTSAPLVSVALA